MIDQSIKVLIVDDEESIRDSIKFHLEDLGYDVTAVEAPNLCPVYCHDKCTAETRCADVILIDQNMPGMTGSEFLRMQAERGCKLPSDYKMIMTADITNEVKTLAGDLGCKVVQKPFPLTDAENFVLFARAAIRSNVLK